MNKILHRAMLAALLAGGSISIMISISPVAVAAEEEIDTDISRRVGALYNEAAREFQRNEDFPAAHEILAEARALEDKTPWETYTIEKLDMQLYLNQQELGPALPLLEAMFATGVAPQEDREAYMRIAMLLANNAQDYPQVITYGTEAISYPGWDDQADEVMVTAYYFNGDFASAEQYALDLIARKEAVGESASLQMLNVLVQSQQEQGKELESMETAGWIAVADPSVQNWIRVIDHATIAPNLQDHHYFNLYRLRRKTDTLAPADYLEMANLAIGMGLPVELQSVLDEAIGGGILQADEVSIAEALVTAGVLAAQVETQLGDLASEAAADPTGLTEVIYGELLYSNGRAADGEAAIRRGIEKGGFENPADVQILLGIVLLEQGKAVEAQAAFQQAAQDPVLHLVAWVWDLYASLPDEEPLLQ